MDELHLHSYQKMNTEDYIELKRNEYQQAKNRICEKFMGLNLDNVDDVLEKSFRIIKRVKTVDVSLTHGDFQAGNILIPDTAREDIWLIDWEDAGVRASVYDDMTWILKSRSPSGLRQRVRDFLRNPKHSERLSGVYPGIAVAFWAIEEWIWLLNASSRMGITKLSPGLCQHFREIL